MIKTPTVLVLGAGASQPYGFPLGRQLLYRVDEIAKDAQSRRLLKELGHAPTAVHVFHSALRHSAQASVDAFLGALRGTVDLS